MTKTSGPSKKNSHRSQDGKRKKKQSADKNSIGTGIIGVGPLLILLLASMIALQATLRLLGIPMERDEAGVAYIGHGRLHGKSLYVDMVDNKLPGLYMLYGLFATIFGYNATGVHLCLL